MTSSTGPQFRDGWRYVTVEEQEFEAAVAGLNHTRKGAEEAQATESEPGPESVSVDGP